MQYGVAKPNLFVVNLFDLRMFLVMNNRLQSKVLDA